MKTKRATGLHEALLVAASVGLCLPTALLSAPVLLPACAQTATKESATVSAATVEKLIKTAPQAYSTHMTAAKFYEQKGIIGQAQDEYRQAITCKGATAEAYKHLAQLLLKSADQAESERIARAGLKLFPKDYGMLLTTGYILHNEGKLNEAMLMYEAARKVQPNTPEIYVALADVASGMGRPQRALQYVDKAITLGPPNELILYEQAKVLVSLGRFDEARKPLATNFANNPLNFKNNKLYLTIINSQKMTKEALLVQLCILAEANTKEMNLAKGALKEMIAALPEKDAAETIVRAETLIKDLRLKGRLHFALGDVYDRLGQPQIAINQYQAGLSFDPTLARGYLRLGEDLETYKKDFPGALKNYQKALSLDSQEKETQMRIKQLKTKMK